MRALTYDRVSADRAHGRSVAEQHADNEAECARRGWTIVARYTDNDRGASRHSRGTRPGWERLKSAIANGEGDVLVTWEASRAQRDLAVYLELRELCRRHGIQWCYNGRVYDLTRTDDAFSTGLDALLAEREADLTRDRVLRAVRANAAAGRPHGKLLYGYRREYHPETGALIAQVPRDDQAAIVREIHRRIADGESLRRVTNDLQSRGVPAPRGARWWQQTVAAMATNPAYIGQRVHQGQVVGSASWDALVDELTHYACVRRLTDPARRTTTERETKHLLTGIAVCGSLVDGAECGRPLRRQKNRNHYAYLCPAGWHVSRHQDKLDTYVTVSVTEWLSRPGATEALRGQDEASVDALASLRALQARLEEFQDAAADGSISAAALARIEARLLPQIEEAKRATSRAPAVLRAAASADPVAYFDALTVSDRRALIAAVVIPVVLPAGRGRRTFNPEQIRLDWRIPG